MSSYKSLRIRATGLFFTLSASTDTQQTVCNKHRPRGQAIRKQKNGHARFILLSYPKHSAYILCAYSYTQSLGSGPNKWLLLDILVIMGFSSMQRMDSLLSLCLYSSRSRSGQGPPPSQSSEITQPCLLRESHNIYTSNSTTLLQIPLIFVQHSLFMLFNFSSYDDIQM